MMLSKAALQMQKNAEELVKKGAVPSFAGSALAWFDTERVRSLESFLRTGLPSRKDEAWKYTSVSDLDKSEWVVASPLDAKTLDAAKTILAANRWQSEAAFELVFVNGQFAKNLSRVPAVSGVTIGSVLDVMKSGDTALISDLQAASSLVNSEANRQSETSFTALNTAVFRDAAFVHFAKSTAESRPVIITFVTVSSDSENALEIHPRVFTVFSRSSEGAVIERHLGSDTCYFTNSVTDVVLLEQARATYAFLQQESLAATHVAQSRFHVKRDAYLETLEISLGAHLSRSDLKVRLCEKGAEALVDGVYITTGQQHVDHHTDIEHVAGETTSNQIYKGILDDRSRAVFNGRVWIAKDAQKANASQLNNNLLLSTQAEADTKPQLEIFADDVKAAHGATVGRLDPEHIFYLKSRAIPEIEAVRMLAQGFVLEVIDRRRNQNVQNLLRPVVASHASRVKVQS